MNKVLLIRSNLDWCHQQSEVNFFFCLGIYRLYKFFKNRYICNVGQTQMNLVTSFAAEPEPQAFANQPRKSIEAWVIQPAPARSYAGRYMPR